MEQCAADISLRDNLAREGLEVQPVPRDNNCLFHALARQLEQVASLLLILESLLIRCVSEWPTGLERPFTSRHNCELVADQYTER